MTVACAVHIAVATPQIQAYTDAPSARSAASWDDVRSAVQSYAERSLEAVVRICRAFGIASLPPLVGREACRAAVWQTFDEARAAVGTHGLLVLSFAGHGRLQKDTEDDERDGCDTAWVVDDGPITDDELRLWLHGLPEGCTVIVLGDCCRAGGMELSAALVCRTNPNARPPRPPVVPRIYLNAVDKGSVWIPGAGDRTFAEEVEAFVGDPTCRSYCDLSVALAGISALNKRRVVRCRPLSLLDRAPFR